MGMRLVIGATALVFWAGTGLCAETHPAPDHRRTLAMTGEGTVPLPTEFAVVDSTIRTTSRKAGDALRENRDTVAAVTAALRQMGIADGDVKVVNFLLMPNRAPFDAKSDASDKTVSYTVFNEVKVSLNDISKSGSVMDALIENGAYYNANVNFGPKDFDAQVAEARALAARDARGRAEICARELGLTLGPVISVRENGNPDDADTGPVTAVSNKKILPTRIDAPDQSYTMTVTVVWELR
jgi:uncharacterized protein